MTSINDLRAQLTAEQRVIVNAIYDYFLANGNDPWIPSGILYDKLKKRRDEVYKALEPLTGSVVYESPRGAGHRKFALTLIGILISDQGKKVSYVLGEYLNYVKDQYLVAPFESIDPQKAAEERGLSDTQLHLLNRVLPLSSFHGGGGGNSIGMPLDADELIYVNDFQAYVEDYEFRKFNPDFPIEGGPMVQLFGPPLTAKQQTIFAAQESESMEPDPKRVFIVYGRNSKAYDAMRLFLRALKLDPLDFDEVRNEIGGSPYVGTIVKEGMTRAKAIIVMFTPDEFASLRKELVSAHDTAIEKGRWQPRPNVILEAGMALGIDEQRTILVVFGDTDLASDLHGRHYIRLNNSASAREKLKNALIGVGCLVSRTASDWYVPAIAGDFESCLSTSIQQEIDTSSVFTTKAKDLASLDTVVRTDWEQKYILEDLGDEHLRVRVELSFKVENFGASAREYWPELEIEERYNPTLISLVCHPANQGGYKYGGDKLVKSPDRPGVKMVKGERVEIKPRGESGEDGGCKVYMTYSMLVPENYHDVISFGGPTLGATIRAEFPQDFQFIVDPKRPATKLTGIIGDLMVYS